VTALVFAYIFEVKSVQAWLFAGGKLRDAAGGSALLDALCTWPDSGEQSDIASIAARCAELGDNQFRRRAGGGLHAVAAE